MRYSAYNYFHQGNNYAQLRTFFQSYYGLDIGNLKKTKSSKKRNEQLDYVQRKYQNLLDELSKKVQDNGQGDELFSRYLYIKALYENDPTNDFYREQYIKAIENFTLFAEEKMSEIREYKLNMNSQQNNIEDKFSYLFIEKVSKGTNLGSKIELHLLDAKKLLTDELSSKNYYLRASDSGKTYGLNTSKKLDYDRLSLDYSGNEDLYNQINNLAYFLNSNEGQTIIEQIANLSYQDKNTVNRSVGESRAYDVLLGGKNMARILNGEWEQTGFDILKQVMSKEELQRLSFFNNSLFDDFKELSEETRIANIKGLTGEHVAGLLQGDAQLFTNGGQISNEIQIKTQGFGTNTIGLSKTAMLENWYYMFTNPDLLSGILAQQMPTQLNNPIDFTNFVQNQLNGTDIFDFMPSQNNAIFNWNQAMSMELNQVKIDIQDELYNIPGVEISGDLEFY